ncbi:MAG: hypothetical protein WAT23_00495 [Chromatiaceae bacterium]
MIGILTPAAYWFGHPPVLELAPSSGTTARDRRMTRTPTLDGGAVFNDGGWSEADRIFTLAIRGLDAATSATLATIASYPVQRLSLAHGLYEGRVKSQVLAGGNESSLVFWVSSKLA